MLKLKTTILRGRVVRGQSEDLPACPRDPSQQHILVSLLVE